MEAARECAKVNTAESTPAASPAAEGASGAPASSAVAPASLSAGLRERRDGSTKGRDALYIQLADILRERIYSHEWPSGHKIPSEHALMAHFDVARGTVRKALKSLVDEGLLIQVRGSGTYVAERGLSHPAGVRPLSFADSLREQGQDFTTRVVEMHREAASEEIAAELGVAQGEEILYLQRVRSVGGEPIMCQESWLNLGECPGLDQCDFTVDSLFNAVQHCAQRRIETSFMRYSARVAGSEHGALLACDETSPILILEQCICLEDGAAIEWSRAWFKPGQSIVGTARQGERMLRQ